MKLNKIIIYFLLFLFLFTGTTFSASLDESKVTVPSAILIETNTNKILYEKNSNEKRYPASTTKIMTSIIVLENCKLSDEVIVKYEAISKVPDGYSSANLIVGEILTVEQLLHLTLIESANDAAIVLAQHVAGSIESFATMMNTKAHELGCKNTNFLNPDGQHNENHYSTAYDLYLIADYAMKNGEFKSIVNKALYVVYPTNKYSKERYARNTNQLLQSSSSFYDIRVNGIKTGFTTPAGNCLVASASSNNSNVIVVVLGGVVEANNNSQRYSSAKNLIDYAFNNYSYKSIITSGQHITTIEISNATENTKNLKLLAKTSISAFVNNEIENEFEPKIDLNLNLFAPIKSGDTLGKATYTILGTDYTVDLVASSDVEISESSLIIFIAFVAALILYVFYKFKRNIKRK